MEEIKKPEPKLPALEKKQDTFSIIIPASLERKIRFLCHRISTVEWSGVLFYRVEGSIGEKNLVIHPVDLLQMDKGSSSYTEYKMSPDIISYMVDHPELMNEGIYQGLIHSHNSMATFFSGTDTSTLQSEGNDMAHFVSLIVNNEGKYTAGVTRRVKCTQEVTEKSSYPTWCGETIELEDTFEIVDESIEWFELNVSFATDTDEWEAEMEERMKEVEEIKRKEKEEEDKKKAITTTSPITPVYWAGNRATQRDYGVYTQYGYGDNDDYDSYDTYLNERYGGINKENPSDPTKAQDKGTEANVTSGTSKEDPSDWGGHGDVPYGKLTINPAIIDSIVKQLVTGSVIIANSEGFNLEKWVPAMDRLFKKRFETVENFEVFADGYVQYLVEAVREESLLALLDNDDSIQTAIVAYDVTLALEALPTNIWLTTYINLLTNYII